MASIVNPQIFLGLLVGLGGYTIGYDIFEKLLELGAAPNFINEHNKKSVLIYSIRFFETPQPYTIDMKYTKLLLEYGADVTYAVEDVFDDNNINISVSPLMLASNLSVEYVKLLLKYGADPNRKLMSTEATPFSAALTGFKNRFKVIDYYIDTLNINIFKPMKIVTREPDGVRDTLYLSNYIRKFMAYKKNTKGDLSKQNLLEKLELLGMNF